MKERFMKNGVFSLEYDKETLRDMVLEKQEEIQKQKEAIDKAIDKLYSIPIEATRQEIIDIARETLHILKEVEQE